MSVPFFNISIQNDKVRSEIDSKIKEVIDSGRYILGNNVSEFEKEAAEYTGVKYAVGVANGTDALHLSVQALGIKEGDEVITTPFTFFATSEVISYVGAKPVFVDVDPNTFNIDPNKVKEKITKKTKAILPVHLYGQSADMDNIMSIAKENNLRVIEDSAQAMGAEFKNKQVNSFGDTGCLSFFPTKNLGCFGDGGMILTNSEETRDLLKVLRNHGSTKAYHHEYIGHNSRLDEIQAAILRVKLKMLPSLIEMRRKNASIYNGILKDVKEVQTPVEFDGAKHTYNQYTIKAEKRDGLKAFLQEKGIPAMIYYPIAIHLQNVYKDLGYKAGNLTACDKIQNEVLSLPIFPELTEEQVTETANGIKEFYSK